MLNLTVNPNTSSTDTREVCDTLLWLDGNIYTADNSTAIYHTTTAAGCDSAITLHLTVNHSVVNALSVTATEPYAWNGTIYDASGDYTAHFSTAAGCDSTVTLHLVIEGSGEGIEDAVLQNVKIFVRDREIVVVGVRDEKTVVYDLMGRTLFNDVATAPIKVPASGVYMVRIGAAKARKVVVLR